MDSMISHIRKININQDRFALLSVQMISVVNLDNGSRKITFKLDCSDEDFQNILTYVHELQEDGLYLERAQIIPQTLAFINEDGFYQHVLGKTHLEVTYNYS